MSGGTSDRRDRIAPNRSTATVASPLLTVTARQASAPKMLNPTDAAATTTAVTIKTSRWYRGADSGVTRRCYRDRSRSSGLRPTVHDRGIDCGLKQTVSSQA